ncbi:MAG: ferrous iron transport protein B [Clostridia bacterium]|nr:ferrous iron transport protein B [Clostridia bacterium]
MNYTVSLVGNPNVGKTSLYNRITKSCEHVGNWHGVTVERIGKKVTIEGDTLFVTDLPGLYSLSVCSPEEGIARDEILKKSSDLVINVCEVGNLSRNLYLTLQLLELGVPVVLAVNMMDELYKRGQKLDCAKLEKALGVPVVPVSAKYKGDEKELLRVCLQKLRNPVAAYVRLPYTDKLPIARVAAAMEDKAKKAGWDARWAAIKLLENDSFVCETLMPDERERNVLSALGDMQARVAQVRYEYIDTIADGLILPDPAAKRRKRKHSDNGFALSGLDKIVLNKYLAFPVFLLVMAAVFFITFGIAGNFFTWLLELGIDKLLYAPLVGWLTKIGCPAWIIGLVGDGIVHGVGGIFVFLPQVVLLFFFLALLEDSGYISRVAFMTDGFFRKIGLCGRSAFTLLMGFGCSATAVLTARGLDDEVMRRKTVLLTPFMSCSARLPVYAAIASAFFAQGKPFLIFGMYVLGAAVAIGLAALFEKCVKPLKSGKLSFIMEMPPYRFPTFERVWQIIRHNAKVFIVRVGTVIFALNVIVWMLANFSLTTGYTAGNGGKSILETLGMLIAPVFKPLGFGNWKAVSALLSGLVAKEAVISSVESMGGVSAIFTGAHPALSALAFMAFTLLYVPCVATLGAIKKELGAKWMLFGLIMQLFTAYAVSLIVYTVGLAICAGKGIVVGVGIVALIALMCTVALLRTKKKKGCAHCLRNCNGCAKTKKEEHAG